MDIPYVRGRVAAQAHVALPDGTVEEEYAREGFFGRYAHLYRRHAPVGWTRIEGPLRPRAYDLRELVTADDYLASRHLVLGAWGCGAFHNDPRVAADTLADALDSGRFAGSFAQITIAIPDSGKSSDNLRAFRARLGG